MPTASARTQSRSRTRSALAGREEAARSAGATVGDGIDLFGCCRHAHTALVFLQLRDGGIDLHGGSGAFGGPFDITWTTIEDSTINGDVTVAGYNGFWMGFIRNTVNGSVTLNDNVLVDPDGNEYVTNTIHGSLNCAGNSPAPQIGDSEGSPNQVTGGGCPARRGFSVAVPV